jgi:hypothetical protein
VGEAASSDCSRWMSLIVPKSSSKDIGKENVDINAKVTRIRVKTIFV